MNSGWRRDEQRHAGSEHLDPHEAARYDDKLPFDPSSEVDTLLELGLSSDDTVVDFGTGTGVFPLAIASHCDRVVAVDVSEAMLDLARKKIDCSGIHNIEIVNSGMLSYDHRGDAASFVFTKDTLHHLPDFWKIEALKNIGNTLKVGGILRLRDFVFSFDPQDSHQLIDSWIVENLEETEFTEEEIHRHFRDEYGTYGFLLELILERAGFDILDAEYESLFYAKYTCRWEGSD